MARKFLTALDLAKNELQNAKLQNLSADPSSPVLGQTYFNTTTNKIRTFNGSTWDEYGTGAGSGTVTSVSVVSANGLAGTVATATTTPAITLSTSITGVLKGNGTAISAAVSGTDYAPPTATSSALKGNGSGGFTNAILNDVGVPTSAYPFNSQKITGLADPTGAQDAATKAYVDATAIGIDFKPSVKAATTATLATNTYANGTSGVGATLTATSNAALAAVDGITLTTGDRLLVKNEATGANNGIYTVTQVGSAGAPYILTRATDADTTTELTPGALAYVEQGTTNGTQQWVLTTTGAITIGTTAQTWTQFSGASTLSAGGGLTATGNVFAVGAGTGIVVNADNVTVDRSTNGSTVPLKYTATIGDGSTTAIAVTHSLGNQDVIAQVRDASTNAVVECDIVNTSTTVTTFTFTTAPAANAYKVVVMG